MRVTIAVVVTMLVGAASAGAAAKLITGKQIKNGSITKKDLAKSARPKTGPRGPVGPQGQQGEQGPQGVPGPAGSVGATQVVLGPKVDMTASGDGGNVKSSTATCPSGTGVISGGFDTGVRTFIAHEGVSGNGYFVIGVNNGPLSTYIQANAVCAAGAPTPTGSSLSPSRAALERAAVRRYAAGTR